MRRISVVGIVACSVFVCATQAICSTQTGADQGMSGSGITPKTALVSVPFISEPGQLPGDSARFYARTFGGAVYATPEGIVYALPKIVATPSGKQAKNGQASQLRIAGRLSLRESFSGGRPLTPAGEEQSNVKISVFAGGADQWRSGLPAYDSVSLGEPYPGIRVSLKAYGDNVEKIFTVQPGADPAMIRMTVEGALGLSTDERGELVVDTCAGDVRFSSPKAWQERDGARQEIQVAYSVSGNQYGFALGEYDSALSLFIDPLLASTLLGCNRTEAAHALAVDGAQNVYVAGKTLWNNFPATPGAYDTNWNGAYDVFVAKFDSNLTNLQAATYLGGITNDGVTSTAISTINQPHIALALDSQTNVLVAGSTQSSNFPVTVGAWDTNFHGPDREFIEGDVFISKLDNTLTNLLASTFLGGTNDDYACAIAIDGADNVFVAGYTSSTNFPVTAGAYQTDPGDGWSDNGFISKLTPDLSDLTASTYLCGSSYDYILDIILAAGGTVFVSGSTMSTNFPTTAGAYCRDYQGAGMGPPGDAFASILDAGLSNVLASTYLGGSGDDESTCIGLDSQGHVFVAGYTYSTNFPTTPGACGTPYASDTYSDCFISRFNSSLTNLEASTYLGGDDNDWVEGMEVTGDGKVYITGFSDTGGTQHFPSTPGAYQTTLDEIFISRLSSGLDSLEASTFFGCDDPDNSTALTLDARTNVYIAGYSGTGAGFTPFPTTADAYQRAGDGSTCAFVSKFDPMLSAYSGPAGLIASLTNTAMVALSWSNEVFSTSYVVYRNDSNTIYGAVMIGATNALAYHDTTAIAGSNYFYFIKGKFRSETSGPSDSAYGFRAFLGAPGTPTGAAASQGTYSNGVLVSWQASAGATNYSVWRNSTDDVLGATLIGNTASLSYMDTSATPGVECFYWVKAMNATGASAFSSPAAQGFRRADGLLNALNLPLYIPLFLSGDALWFEQTPINHDGISAAQSGTLGDPSWPETEQTDMEIHVSGPGQVGFWWQVSSETNWDFLCFYIDSVLQTNISGDVSWEHVSFPLSSGNHTLLWSYYKDTAEEGADAGWVDEVSLDVPPLQAPANLAAGDGADTDRVALMWDAAPTATGYAIWRNASNDEASATLLGGTGDTNYPDTTAAPGLLYYYWVRGTNANGAGPSASDTGWRILPAPAGLAASDGAYTDRVEIAWGAVANADGYTLWRAPDPGAYPTLLGAVSSAGYTDTSTAAGETNWYWVKATNALGESAFSASDAGWRAVVTNAPPVPRPPVAPRNVTATDGAHKDRVQVSWDPVANASGYIVWRGLSDATNWAAQIGATAATSYPDTTAEPGIHYYYWARATNDAGASLFGTPDTGWRYRYTAGDYDGDGVSDLAVYDATHGLWYIRTMSGTVLAWAEQWGGPGMWPVAGDYDGDGGLDLAVYQGSAGCWYIRTLAGTSILWADVFGGPGMYAVSGDYDADCRSDLAVYDQSSGQWFIRTVAGAVLTWSNAWGGPGMWPVAGDYSANGASDITVYSSRLGQWFASTLNGTTLLWAEQWGGPGLWPVTGDYDGDGVYDMAVYAAHSGCWYIASLQETEGSGFGVQEEIGVQSSVSGIQTSKSPNTDNRTPITGYSRVIAWAETWGGPGMWPVSGDYDGDGISDMAVYEPSSGKWFIRSLSGTVILWAETWGGPGMWPVCE